MANHSHLRLRNSTAVAKDQNIPLDTFPSRQGCMPTSILSDEKIAY
ncbi:hypothetical protein RQP50_25500 [Paenibacillus sp. chi10]|uniref:Uncharacterized protein n=1 Tax=Paenibacillus suaedae TaxID=3077233 RepID=A0AAJ2N726_9BACL|nr:hypothetical protein [Paenibacillus sp. chi10]MDT8979591.1 hypothetical protein [Paenibacillus sp. chi10]